MIAPRDTINQSLRQFAASIQAPRLELNEEGVCAFTYEGKYEVVIEVPEEASKVYFYAPVITLPTKQPSELAGLYEKLLKLNAFSALTRGATVALDPRQPHILLCYQYPIHLMDEVRFYNVLTNFVLALDELHKQLSDLEFAVPEAYSVSDPLQIFINRV